MKIRRGFVSNSSSSSFVVVGVELNVPEDEKDDMWEKFGDLDGYLYLVGDDGGLKEDKIVLGKVVANINSEDGYMESIEISTIDLEKMGEEVIKKAGKYAAKGKKPKIYCGTRAT